MKVKFKGVSKGRKGQDKLQTNEAHWNRFYRGNDKAFVPGAW